MEEEIVRAREACFPEENDLMHLYAYYCKVMTFWKIEEAVALVLRMYPRCGDLLPTLDPVCAKHFIHLVDMMQRQFPTGKVIPSELREWAPRVGIQNELLWSAIDYYVAKHSESGKVARKSDITRRQKNDDLIAAAMAKKCGFKDGNNGATQKIHDVLSEWGTHIDHEIIRDRLKAMYAKRPQGVS